jgi:hypothetical protein
LNGWTCFAGAPFTSAPRTSKLALSATFPVGSTSSSRCAPGHKDQWTVVDAEPMRLPSMRQLQLAGVPLTAAMRSRCDC